MNYEFITWFDTDLEGFRTFCSLNPISVPANNGAFVYPFVIVITLLLVGVQTSVD